MVQYGIKTDHLEHLGDHGPEMIQNGIEDDNPGQGYVSFNQPLRGVCVLQPNPSEGYVSVNQPFRGVGVRQPTLPRGMSPSTNPSEGYVSFNQPFRGLCESGGPGPNSENEFRKGTPAPQGRGHVRKVRDAHGRVG